VRTSRPLIVICTVYKYILILFIETKIRAIDLRQRWRRSPETGICIVDVHGIINVRVINVPDQLAEKYVCLATFDESSRRRRSLYLIDSLACTYTRVPNTLLPFYPSTTNSSTTTLLLLLYAFTLGIIRRTRFPTGTYLYRCARVRNGHKSPTDQDA
jgi:hypothetical protein